MYKDKIYHFYYKFIYTNWKNNFEQILPKTNNDKDNMFLIFDYFKKQMNPKDINPKDINITPNYMASIFFFSFMGGNLEVIHTNKDNLTIGLIKFFTYIKNEDIYKNYIVNRLNILRKNMATILKLLNGKQLLEGVFREAGLQLHLDTFYLENQIDKDINIYTLCTLIKNYIKYLFISEHIQLDTTPNFEENSVAQFVETFLSNLIEDKQIMTSIFIYLKKVMEALEITKMTPQNISVVITPNFFPNLQLKTINNTRTSAEINKNYIPLFTYIKKKETYTNDENGPIFNITKPLPRELSV